MSQVPIGIDLGTSTSEIAIFRENEPKVIYDPGSYNRSPIIPSIVAIDRKGQLLVGEPALSYVDLPGHGAREVKRLMGTAEKVTLGGRSYSPQEISALILKHLKKNAEQTLGSTIRKVVLSVPANFNDAARQATKDAAELAGLEVVRLINEPTAAALAFGICNIDTEAQVVVFDFGGGTLDITVLEMMSGILDVKTSYGDPFLGGKDLDTAVLNLLKERFEKEHPAAKTGEGSKNALRTEAEKAKILLSRNDSTLVRCANYAVLEGRPVDLEYELTREEFEAAIAPLLAQAGKCIEKALEAKKIRIEAIDQVLLVGGTTNVPAVRKLVADTLKREPIAKVDPDLAVAQGAAIQAALAAGVISGEEGIILTDVCPFGLGVAIAGWVGRHFVTNLYDSLIAPNTTIPFSVKRTYSLLHEEQKEVTLSVFQDHEGSAATIEEAISTGLSGTIRDIPLSQNGVPHPVEVEFSYDINGIVKLHATIPTTGQEVEVISFNDASRRLPISEREESRSRVDELWKMSPIARDYEPIINKAEKLINLLSGGNREALQNAMDRLNEAIKSKNDAETERAGDYLTDLVFEMDVGE